MESAAPSDLPECSENPRSSKKARVEETRNWLELPPDIVSTIFLKLGPVEVLLRTQWVCKTWQKLSYQPELYRYVDMRHKNLGFDSWKRETVKMAKEAIDRSAGGMVEFAVEQFANGELLRYIRAKCSSLKCIRFYKCEIVRPRKLIKLAKTLNQLEELEVSFCHHFSPIVLETFGQSCPQLKSFRLNSYCDRCSFCDSDALAIAESMPGLQHLDLLGSNLSCEGLQAILDGCPHLKFIDLRECYMVQVGNELSRRNIKWRGPNDSMDDYEYEYNHPDDAEYEEYEYTTADYECYSSCSSPDTPNPEEEAKRKQKEYENFLACL